LSMKSLPLFLPYSFEPVLPHTCKGNHTITGFTAALE
jgi:hypothetical protein